MGWEAKSEAFLEGILENQILETYGGHFFCFVSVFEDGLTSGTGSLPSRFLAIPVPCHQGVLPSRSRGLPALRALRRWLQCRDTGFQGIWMR